MSRLLAAAALVLAAIAPVYAPAYAQDNQASPFERARLAYAARDYFTARDAAGVAAASGEAQAMVLAGLLQERGLGGPVDMQAARTWYERAADLDDTDGMLGLARLAADSQAGLAPSDARGFLRRAQARGAAGADLLLGQMLARGVGGPPDPAGARELLAPLADAGDSEAQIELAYLELERGNAEAAREQLERAAAGGDAEAAYQAGILWADDEAAPDGLARAAGLFRQAAEGGHAAGATLYAHALWQGAGVAEDRAEAVRWYGEAAGRGDAEGQFYYAVMLFAGAGLPANVEESYYWALRSAAADPQPQAGYGDQRAALRAQAEAALNEDARARIAARARTDAGALPLNLE